MGWPEPPREEMLGMMDESEISQLWTDLIHELMDDTYAGRVHGNRRTYDAGCKGPLCTKAVRDHARRRQNTGISEKYRYIDPLLEFWAPIARARIRLAIESARLSIAGE